ncbi:MAG TPA: hypothetical protein DEB69_00705 [Candidatus Komeilibacteria bacterium]|nr:hypothetical protein [Candidatus Komeilibacteria bacterium]
MVQSPNQKINAKISNKTLLNWLAILAVIIAVWLIGYFTGIDEGVQRTANVKPDAEIITSAPEKNTKPPLPQLPQISQKSTNNQLPELPRLP